MSARPLTMARAMPGLCGVCRARDIGSGVIGSEPRGRAIWVCDDITCLEAARRTINVPQRIFDEYEKQACDIGIREAAEYARAIGTSDLAQMTPDQIAEFGLTLVAGYRTALAAELKGGANAPF